MKIGLIVGRENTFPGAFIDRVNSKNVDGITAEMVQLGGTRMDEPIPYSGDRRPHVPRGAVLPHLSEKGGG